MSYWVEDNIEWIVGIGIVVLLALCIWAYAAESKQMQDQQRTDLALAHTAAETLQVRLTYRKLESDRRTRDAIAIGSGVVAGSAAGRR